MKKIKNQTMEYSASNELVSIVIPVWGEYEKFYERCLSSVLKQTYKNYEIIKVDTETDLPTARNVGIRKAKGKWILPLDVDDEIEPTYLEETVGKGDIVTTAQTNGVVIEREIEIEKFKTQNQLIACSLFKKEVWENIGGYDENLKEGYEDWDFWWRACKAGYKITLVDKPLYTYTQREDSMVDNTKKNQKEILSYIRKKNDDTNNRT